jgi:hypothetical protein
MDKPHVFIGPTITEAEAKEILPNAYYHHPIRCGELIRLLRLKPKTVLIIDGCYEFTPAVWHKEIMLAIDLGVEVIGASSMGALRASELHQVGMKGIGKIFQAFRDGHLNDDDEVAVLHKSEEEGFVPINDAMVNIRETLKLAVDEHIISSESEEILLAFCKDEFYPNRLLSRAVSKAETLDRKEQQALKEWLAKHGVIDLKKEDARLALQTLKARELQEHSDEKAEMPVTKFINQLIDYGFSTPFLKPYDFLPDREKELIRLEKENEPYYRLLTDFAILLKNLYLLSEVDKAEIDSHVLDDLVKKEGLYSLKISFSYLESHPELNGLYDYLCQQVCLSGLNPQMVQSYLREAQAFYLLDEQPAYHKALEKMVVLLLIIEYQMRQANIHLKKESFLRGVGKMARSRGFDREQTISWLGREDVDSAKLMNLLTIRQKINCLHQGIGDLIRRNDRNTPTYFDWLFDAWHLSESKGLKEPSN